MRSTVVKYLNNIQVVYEIFDVIVEKLPYFSKKQANYFEPIGFNDLLIKEEIESAIGISDPLLKAVIVFNGKRGFWQD